MSITGEVTYQPRPNNAATRDRQPPGTFGNPATFAPTADGTLGKFAPPAAIVITVGAGFTLYGPVSGDGTPCTLFAFGIVGGAKSGPGDGGTTPGDAPPTKPPGGCKTGSDISETLTFLG
jgi:hypothetical protein